jgi:predicted nucleic acid-binding protein
MMPIIVADTGPLIALAKLQQLDLLAKLFEKIHLPQTVYQEATRDLEREDARLIAAFVGYCQLCPDIHNTFADNLLALLDKGETQALTLARELNCGVLIDERRGRQVAKHYQIPVVGTLGMLL